MLRAGPWPAILGSARAWQSTQHLVGAQADVWKERGSVSLASTSSFRGCEGLAREGRGRLHTGPMGTQPWPLLLVSACRKVTLEAPGLRFLPRVCSEIYLCPEISGGRRPGHSETHTVCTCQGGHRGGTLGIVRRWGGGRHPRGCKGLFP